MADTPATDTAHDGYVVREVQSTSQLTVETNINVPKDYLGVERLKTPTTPNAKRPSVMSRTSSMNGPLYMQTSNNKILIRRVKRKGHSTVQSLTRWLLNNQIGVCVFV